MEIEDKHVISLLEKEINFVYFKHPSNPSPTLFIDDNSNEETEEFLFSDFESKNPIIRIKNGTETLVNKHGSFQNLISSLSPRKSVQLSNLHSVDRKEYQSLLEAALEQLKEQSLEKVVLSRIINANIDSKAQIVQAFRDLANQHPQSLTYIFTHKTSGIWMGATPEKLLEGETSNYITHSLAGTMSREESRDWTQKEIEEQAYVTSYIEQTLNEVGAKSIKIRERQTIELAQIKHIRNIIGFSYSGDITNLIKHLHPTPAIAGTPKELALSFIKNNEKHLRHYYCGYLGWINDKSCSLYVNLRCMHIHKNNGYLFVGGGITKKSNIEQEWKETENKALTLLSVL